MSRSLRRLAARALHAVDRGLAQATLGDRFEGGLITFLFHGVFLPGERIDPALIDPYQRTTTTDLEVLIEHLLGAGYRFVTPDEVATPGLLSAADRCAMLTFDDGYANNLRLLPLLSHYRVPATVFVASGYVERGEAYWWDVVHREGVARGLSAEQIEAEKRRLKGLPVPAQRRALIDAYGRDALKARHDLDRPLTVAELRDLAASPWITIGNHTVDHAILTSQPPDEQRRQIAGCQAWLKEALGETPMIVSYPNGNFDDAVLQTARDVGLTLGITTVPRRTALPLQPAHALTLGRFVIDDHQDVVERARACRAGVNLRHAALRRRRPGY